MKAPEEFIVTRKNGETIPLDFLIRPLADSSLIEAQSAFEKAAILFSVAAESVSQKFDQTTSDGCQARIISLIMCVHGKDSDRAHSLMCRYFQEEPKNRDLLIRLDLMYRFLFPSPTYSINYTSFISKGYL